MTNRRYCIRKKTFALNEDELQSHLISFADRLAFKKDQMMSTMAVVTQIESAAAVVRWAARFATMRNDSLIVFSCEFGDQVMPATPVDFKQLDTADDLVRITADSIGEIPDGDIQLFRQRLKGVAQRSLISKLQEAGIKKTED